MIRFYLNNTLVSNPIGWEEIKSKLVWDESLNVLLLTNDIEVEFVKDGYSYLYNLLTQSGYCAAVEVRIDQNCYGQNWQQIIVGKLFLSDVQFNERTCTAKVKIGDNSYFAQINNNRRIKTVPDATVSKMGETITAGVQYDVTLYSVLTAGVIRDVPSIRIFEVFRNLTAYVSDNRIGFASTLFDVGGEFDGLCLTTGARIRTGTAFNYEPFSFDQLFKEIRARIPIRATIDNPYGNPVLRIELESYFQQAAITDSYDDIAEIITKCDTSKLYSKVLVGSGIIDDSLSLAFPEDIDFFGFKPEEFYTRTECNTEAELDLQGDWAVSSNIIQKAAAGDQAYDDTLILLDTEYVDPNSGLSKNDNFLNLSPALFYYNRRLTNEQILTRYIGGIPSNLVKVVSEQGEGLFKAFASTYNSALPITVEPRQYPTVVFNNGGYYNGSTNRFTAAEAGVYDFRLQTEVTVTAISSLAFGFSIRLRQYDAGNTLIQDYVVSVFNFFASLTTLPATANFTGTRRIVMREGDYIQVALQTTGSHTATFTSNGYWECYANSNGSVQYVTSDPDDYPVFIHEYEYPMSQARFEALVNGQRGFIRFRQNGQLWRKARVKEIIYNNVRGTATFKLISDKNTVDAI